MCLGAVLVFNGFETWSTADPEGDEVYSRWKTRGEQRGRCMNPARCVAACASLVCLQAVAFDHRRAGDVLENALPAGAALYTLWEGDRQGTWQFGASYAVTLLATQGLKKGLDVRRPDGGVESFPSGHAAKAFAAATYMHRRHGMDRAWPWYAAGAYVGWTRVNANRHRWVDIAGSLAVAGLSSWWLVEPAGERDVAVLPLIGPGHASLVLQARW